MASDNTSSRLHDHIDLLTGFAFKSARFIEAGPGIPLLRGDNVAQGSLRWNNLRKWSSSELKGLEKYRLKIGDIVLAMDRPWIAAGLKYARLRDSDVPSLLVQRVARLRSKNGLLQSYLSLLIGSPAFTEYVLSVQTGTTIPHISGSQIGGFEFELPPVAEQARAALLIGAIEDRIDLLRETNATLEAIAQALFKSWFVDFDPVRAKAEGREPEGMDAATAALFPSEFEDSVLGPIPLGWKTIRLADLCNRIQNGSTPSRKNSDFWDGGSIPWFKTGELSDGFLTESSELIAEEALRKTSVKVLPRHAVLMAIYAAPTVGRLGVLTREAAFNQACTGMIAKTDVGPWFLLQTLRHGRDWFNSRANGAAQQNISKSIVESLPCIKPPADLLAEYSKVAGALYGLAEENARRVGTLSDLRDTLLPRLISGRLRIPEAETLGEELLA